LPVIVTDEGGPKELMVNGETGLVVEKIDRQGLVNAIQFFLQEPERRRMMGEAARAFTERGALTNGNAYHTILKSSPAVANL
jgi:glycosyltransferase involved in cell wall biosynthesis